MKNKLKKWHIILMSFMALFIAVFATLFNLKADPVDEETGEILMDNWELSIVFYDSTVNNGKTPLTSIDWDASDGGRDEGIPRTITVQINYKNNSAVTTYQPGELKITVPNLVYSETVYVNNPSTGNNDLTYRGSYDAKWSTNIILGANDSTHTGYDWNFRTGESPLREHETFSFTNANTIEEKTNFEGNIQIAYIITPLSEYPEKYEAECTHSYNTTLKANLSYLKDTETIKINSGELQFNYLRNYIHPWTHLSYTLDKRSSKITSYENLCSNPENYFWVIYNFYVSDINQNEYYPNIKASNFFITDTFPSECVVIRNGEILSGTINPSNNKKKDYIFNIAKDDSISSYYKNTTTIHVGYPKSIYNEASNNLTFNNYAELHGTYSDETSPRKLSADTVNINLNNFSFTYSGNLYSIIKTKYTFEEDYYYYEALMKPNYTHACNYCFSQHVTTQFKWEIDMTARYSTSPMTIMFGDDLLYITDENGNYRKLTDEEYFFSSIRLPQIKNATNEIVPYNKYSFSLYVRYKNENEYVFYKSLANQTANSHIDFETETNRKIVAWYIKAEDATESLFFKQSGYSSGTNGIGVHVKPLNNISETGTVYNFAFLKVYFKDDSGNLILQNAPNISNYANFITKEEIANFDMTTHGTYVQRSASSRTYSKLPNLSPKPEISGYKSMTNFSQNIEQETFTGTSTLGIYLYGDDRLTEIYLGQNYLESIYFDLLKDFDAVNSIYGYDLLPEGMELTSTKEEMINSIDGSAPYSYFLDLEGNTLFKNNQDFKNFIKEHTEIYIENNWNNTNRTRLTWKINFKDTPFVYLHGPTSGLTRFSMLYNYSVSYDAYMEYGSTWTNYVYYEAYFNSNNKLANYSSSSTTSDSGKYDSDTFDINQNNNIAEVLSYGKASKTINSIVSSHQDVTTYVKTDQSNYSTGIVDTSNNSEYEYKLRARTGAADVTNFIIYTNIEEAQPEKTRWKGEFLDVNFSYAESKGYIVKPYYSENPTAGNLYNEDGTLNSNWKKYIPDTPAIIANGLAITFDENFKTYNSSDYLYIYYYYNGQLYRTPSYYNTTLAGKTIEIPSTNIYFYWSTNSSSNDAYGFKINNIEPKVVTSTIGSTVSNLPSINPIELTNKNYPETNHNPYNNDEQILWHYTYLDNLILEERIEHIDKTKVKSLAFEYLDSEGNPAILPMNSLTYVLIKMKSPADENIKTLARMDCWTQWNAIDEFGHPVDFITGINSNVVKVALPNSVKEDSSPSISLRFIKEINGTDLEFKNMKLDKTEQQTFMIRLTSLTENDNGTYNQVTALLKSDQELIISQIPVGTYLLEELGDNYFDFVEFTNNNDPEIVINGVTLERTNQGYIITISEALTENVEFNIKVTNEIEPNRFYENKNSQENLFLKNKIEENE